MKRRQLMLLLGVAMVAASTLRAQQKAMPVIGFLSAGSPGAADQNVAAFLQGLGETGYVEGQNVVIEYRWAEGRYDRLPALATDLVSRRIDVIAALGLPSALAAKSATSTIPIAFSVGDPVERGLVASLARPGGNLTGVSLINVELMPKRLELLSDLVPQAGVIAVLLNPNNANTERTIRDMKEAARAKGGAARCLEGRHRKRDRRRFRLPRPNASRGCSSSRPIHSSLAASTSSSRWHHAMPYRRSMRCVNSSRPAA